MVARSGRGVDLVVRRRGRVAVVVTGQRGVVHVADRPVAHQVDLLTDGVVGGVVGGLVVVPLGRRTEGVRDELLGVAARDPARGVVVDAVAELVRDDVDRADPARAGLRVADLHLGAVVVGVHVGQADPDRDPAAGAVHARAAQPRGEHALLLLGTVERVDTAGLPVGRVPVAPGVVAARVGHVAGGVLALERRGGGVDQRVGGAGELRRDRHGPGVARAAGALDDVLLGGEHLAGGGVDEDREARGPALAGAGHDRLVGQVRPGLTLEDDQLGGLDGRLGHLALGDLLGPGLGDRGLRGGHLDRRVLGDRGAQQVALGVGGDDEVTADDAQALVGAVVGDVLEPGGLVRPEPDGLVLGAELQRRGIGGDEGRGRPLRPGPGLLAADDRAAAVGLLRGHGALAGLGVGGRLHTCGHADGGRRRDEGHGQALRYASVVHADSP